MLLLNSIAYAFLFGLVRSTEVLENECGIVKYIEPTIVGGTQTSRGEWPFIAALYYTGEAKFFCGATLISANHVLTAAHCVQQKNSAFRLTPEDVVALLGVYNLDSKIERGVQNRDVAQIHTHPDWKVYHEKYDADIAIFVLSDAVIFSRYVRPVCIPSDDDDFPDIKGSIVGWGLAENATANKHESIPRHAFTNALNNSYCYTADPVLAIFSSTRTFCGGGEGGSPNKGDSGGGFFVYSGSVWMQYGIISASIGDKTGVVLPKTFSVYTNVKSFRNWITDITESTAIPTNNQNSNKDTDTSGATKDNTIKPKIKLYCNYEFTSFYTCSVWESNVTAENLEVETFTGTHLPGYTDQNITQIWFWHGTVSYIPDGIGLMFKHLEKLLVGYDDRNLGLKLLKRSNFQNLKMLTLLQFHISYIETVDEDTLFDLPYLETFELKDSRLKVLHEKTFERNPKLRFVKLNSNQLEVLPRNLFKNNLMLQEVYFKENKLRTISIDFTQLLQIKNIDLHGNICIDKGLEDVANLTDLQNILNSNC